MNALWWVLQIVLALLYLSGGAYKTFMFARSPRGMRVIRLMWPSPIRSCGAW